MSETSHTPGPWAWRGSPTHGGIYLASLTRGLPTAMDFVRLGMRNAQPRFPNGMFMEKAQTMGVPEVPYRDNIVAINHPNAHLIAAAPDLLDALVGLLDWLDTENEPHENDLDRLEAADAAARVAIKKALNGRESTP